MCFVPSPFYPHNDTARWVRLRGRTGLGSFHGTGGVENGVFQFVAEHSNCYSNTGILPLYYVKHRNTELKGTSRVI